MSPLHTADEPAATLRAIERDIAARDFNAAAAALLALRGTLPNDARVYRTEARLARALGKPEFELAALARAATLAPTLPGLQIELARAFLRANRESEALMIAHRAVQLAPDDLETLVAAASITYEAGNLAASQECLERALALQPGDEKLARMLALCLTHQARHAEAEPHWQALLAAHPHDVQALSHLGQCLIGLKRDAEAITLLEAALALAPDDENLHFHLALAHGETPPTQPKQLLRTLFDQYAPRFDAHVVGQLKYDVPQRVAQLIRTRRPALDASVLDLGCGTGLLAVALGRLAAAFVGIDISAKMIELAAQQRIYTDLRVGDLLEELQRTPEAAFDFVVANDVFIYFGDLREAIPAAFRATRPGGALIFSCEAADETEGALVLRPSKRYAHSRRSVEALCRGAGFATVAFEAVDVRLDGATPIPGFIAIAEKS